MRRHVTPRASAVTAAAPRRGDATTDSICADTDVTLTKILPKVLFLLDQSSSMYFNKFPNGKSNGCNPDCRWTVLKDVLIGPAATPGGIVKQLQAEAELGVEMYSATDPNPNDGDNSLLPPPTDAVCPRFNGKTFNGVTFALNNAAAIDALLRPATVDDDTPTGPAIRAVVGLAPDGGVVDPKGFAAVASGRRRRSSCSSPMASRRSAATTTRPIRGALPSSSRRSRRTRRRSARS